MFTTDAASLCSVRWLNWRVDICLLLVLLLLLLPFYSCYAALASFSTSHCAWSVPGTVNLSKDLCPDFRRPQCSMLCAAPGHKWQLLAATASTSRC